MPRRDGRGLAVLRVMRIRAKRSGDKDLASKLGKILRDDDAASAAGVALEDEAGGNGFFRDILDYFLENPGSFKEFVEWFLELISQLQSDS